MTVLREIKSLSPPGRFLTKTKDCILWYPQDDESVLLKIKQALRENKKIVKEECGNKTRIPKSLNNVVRNKERLERNEESAGKAMKASRTKHVEPLNHAHENSSGRNSYSKEDMDRLISLCKGLNGQEKMDDKRLP